MKKCSRCKEEKALDSFAKKRSNKDGLYIWCRACCAQHKIKTINQISEYKKNWANNNRDKLRSASSRWYADNKQKKQSYAKKMYRENIQRRLSCTLRSRLSHAIRKNIRAGSAVKDLGCSLSFLQKHLESLFKPGMTWENYGQWHIDHIVPLCSFDLSSSEEVKKACHYSNLQPLWAKDNLMKGANLLTDMIL